MQILTRLDTLDLTRNATNTEIFSSIDTLVKDNCGLTMKFNGTSVTRGTANPHNITACAKQWNWRIKEQFLHCAHRMTANSIEGIPTDNLITFKAKIAAHDIDNDWFPNSNVGLILPAEISTQPPMFLTIMSKHLEEDAQNHPEEYILVIGDISD